MPIAFPSTREEIHAQSNMANRTIVAMLAAPAGNVTVTERQSGERQEDKWHKGKIRFWPMCSLPGMMNMRQAVAPDEHPAAQP